MSRSRSSSSWSRSRQSACPCLLLQRQSHAGAAAERVGCAQGRPTPQSAPPRCACTRPAPQSASAHSSRPLPPVRPSRRPLSPFEAGRYHSLVIDKAKCPADLEVTAWTADGTIMGVRHKVYPHIQGVQFHPESIITAGGKAIVENWVKITRGELAAV